MCWRGGDEGEGGRGLGSVGEEGRRRSGLCMRRWEGRGDRVVCVEGGHEERRHGERGGERSTEKKGSTERKGSTGRGGRHGERGQREHEGGSTESEHREEQVQTPRRPIAPTSAKPFKKGKKG